MRFTTTTVVFLAALIGVGCGPKDEIVSPPVQPAGNNLTASSLQILSATPTVGYPMNVAVALASTVAKEEVSVVLYAIGKDLPEAERRQIPLGTRTIARVDAGSKTYNLAFDIPANIAAREYYVAAIVNPVGAVEDTNPDDNTASTIATLSLPPSPNIFIQDAVLDDGVVLLDTSTYEQQVAADKGVHNSDSGVTIQVGAQGATAPIAMQAYAMLRMRRADRTGPSAVHDVPLYLWNSDANKYTNAYAVNPPAAAAEWLPLGDFTPQDYEVGAQVLGFDVASNQLDRRSAHLDLYFPGKLASEFEIKVRHLNTFLSDPQLPPPDLTPDSISSLRSFLSNLPFDPVDQYNEGPAMAVLSTEICTQIRPVAFTDRDAADNERCTPITLQLPPLPVIPPVVIGPVPPPPNLGNKANPILFSKSYRINFGNGIFGVGASFEGLATADNRGLIASVTGALPVTALAFTTNFVEANGRAQVMPLYVGAPAGQSPGVHLDLKILGVTIDSYDSPTATLTGVLGNVSKTYEKTKVFAVGPVPVTVTGFIIGSAGLRYALGVTGTALNMEAKPFAQLEAGVRGGVGLPGFGAGPYGSLKPFVSEEFVMATAASLAVINDGSGVGPAQLVLAPTLRVANVITGPRGEAGVYADYSYPTLKTCKSWGVPYPCPGISTSREYLPLVSFKSFVKTDTLLNLQAILNVVSYSDGQFAYFTP